MAPRRKENIDAYRVLVDTQTSNSKKFQALRTSKTQIIQVFLSSFEIENNGHNKRS